MLNRVSMELEMNRSSTKYVLNGSQEQRTANTCFNTQLKKCIMKLENTQNDRLDPSTTTRYFSNDILDWFGSFLTSHPSCPRPGKERFNIKSHHHCRKPFATLRTYLSHAMLRAWFPALVVDTFLFNSKILILLRRRHFVVLVAIDMNFQHIWTPLGPLSM